MEIANETKGFKFKCVLSLTPRLKEIVLAGGVLALAKSRN